MFILIYFNFENFKRSKLYEKNNTVDHDKIAVMGNYHVVN
jgi:hypothetical protein